MSNRTEVDRLLVMYDRYKALLDEAGAVSSQLAKAKLLKRPVILLQNRHDELKRELQEVSDAMTFANPIIWMMYKDEAYKDEAQPIRKMHAFRVHCSKPGYICTKRFTYLNAQLVAVGKPTLEDGVSYPDTMNLSDAYTHIDLETLSKSTEFMKGWNEYEYNQIDGTVAKWENFS